MAAELFNLKKALQVFGTSPETLIENGFSLDSLPEFSRSSTDNRLLKSWSTQDLPMVGERVGFMTKPSRPVAAAVFVTKGGVLKTSLTLNLARMAALHGIRTCVVGLDMQGDITSTLSEDLISDDSAELSDALEKLSSLRGLADVFTGDAKLEEVIRKTDLPNLSYIPETPELVALDQSLVNRNRREYWLRDNVVTPLKENFDLILMDCSPNWNRLITNALVACDTLISPLECKINNFRNFQIFRSLLSEFKKEMGAEFTHIFVPTRLTPGRKLSREIYQWYIDNLSEATRIPIRETTQGEESVAMRLSIPEYAPSSAAADEIRDLLKSIWPTVADSVLERVAEGTKEKVTLATARPHGRPTGEATL